MTATEDYVRRVVDAAPPLSDDQRRTLRALLDGTRVDDAAPAPAPGMPAESRQRTTLYRYFDEEGVLLYVGITQHPSTRDRTHRKTSVFYEFVSRQEIAWYDDPEAAAIAEREAIRAERPLFNTAHGTDEAKRRLVEYLIRRDALHLLRPASR